MNTFTQADSIPFHIEARRLFRGSERHEHEVAFGVVGVVAPARVIVASDAYFDPVVIERVSRGGLELTDEDRNQLGLESFTLIAGEIVRNDGDSGWWTIPDISDWLRSKFQPPQRDRLTAELRLHVTRGMEVHNTCLIADDDAI